MEHKLASVAEMMLQQQESQLAHEHGLMGTDQGMLGQEEQQRSSKATLQLLCKLCDQALFLLVEWARAAHFFRELKVGNIGQNVHINSYYPFINLHSQVFLDVSSNYSTEETKDPL